MVFEEILKFDFLDENLTAKNARFLSLRLNTKLKVRKALPKNFANFA